MVWFHLDARHLSQRTNHENQKVTTTMEKHKESIGENCQNGILNCETSGTPKPNVPALRFSEFTDEWNKYSFDDIAQYKKGPFGSALKKEIFVPESNDTIKI